MAPSDIWTVFGRLPFVVMLLVLFDAGRRRGWPWRSALLASAAFAAGVSCGFVWLPGVVGGAAGGFVAWLVAQRALGLRQPPLAAAALWFTALLAFGRVGCLLRGCCFGTLCDLPWAVHQASGAPAWVLHHALGLVGDHEALSRAIHPYPLYETLGLAAWLVAAVVLRRRLRSEGALLALTAAYDLALRAVIDGWRATLNVWWAPLRSVAGIDALRIALAAAALVALALGLALERRARARARSRAARREAEPPATASTASPLGAWAVFAGLCAAGLATDGAQNAFLLRVFVVALLASATVLPPPWTLVPRLSAMTSRWLAPAAALVVAAALTSHLEDYAARADDPIVADVATAHGGVYAVDHRRGLLVRLGGRGDRDSTLVARRNALGLDPADDRATDSATSLDLPFTAPMDMPESLDPEVRDALEHQPPEAPARDAVRDARHPRHWVGIEGFGGGASYTIRETCSDEVTTIVDERAGAGLRYEHQRAVGDEWSMVLGARGGFAWRRTRTTTTGGSAPSTRSSTVDRAYVALMWLALWNRYVSVSLGVRGWHLERQTTGPDRSETGFGIGLGGHARFGWPGLGLHFGAFEPDAFVGLATGRVGLAGAFGPEPMQQLEDARFRYFVGAVVFSDLPLDSTFAGSIAFGLGVEGAPTPDLSLGLDLGINRGVLVAASVRYAFGGR